MRYCLLLVIILCSSYSFGQLTRFEKFNYSTVPNDRAAYLLYYTYSKNLKDKERICNWVKEEMLNSEKLTDQIVAYQILGDLEKRKGNYTRSIKYLEKGKEIIVNNEIKVNSRTIQYHGRVFLDLVDDLGFLYYELGNAEMALNLLNESTKLKAHYFNAEHPISALPYLRIAKIYKEQGRLEEARELIEENIDRLVYATSARVNSEHIYTAYFDLASIQMQTGEYNKALRNAKIARKTKFSVLLPKNKLNKAYAEDLIARIYLKMGDVTNARKWQEESEKSFSGFSSTESINYTRIHATRALVEYELKQYSMGFNSINKMMDINLDFISKNFSNLSQIEKEQFYNQISKDLDLYYSLAFNIYDQNNDKDILSAVINRRIQTKGFILNDQNKIKQAIMEDGDEQLKSELADWQNSKEALAYYLFEDPNSPSIDSLNQVINRLERSLSEKTQLLQSSQQQVTYETVKNLLQPSEVAVEIIRYTADDSENVDYAALVMAPDKDDLEFAKLSIPELDETRFSTYYKSAIQYETPDENTYNSIWKIIDEKLNGADRVLLSPDGIYHQININTLQNPSNGNYMIDKYQVVNMTNLKDLANKASDEYASTAHLFGRPQYDYTQEVASYFNISDSSLMRSNLYMELESFQEQQFADLPGTLAEVSSISGTLDNYSWSTTSYTGPVATEQKVKALDNPGIVHIATHGFFLEAQGNINPMIKSGLVLAGVNNQGATLDDGVLTAYEATNLKLDNTWLVVLSACETGLGDVKNGEGVYGLQRALTVAGATNLMMTLWKVDDNATKELMISFYDRLGKGIELEEAFRQSQLELREKYPEPKYWGSFVLVRAKG